MLIPEGSTLVAKMVLAGSFILPGNEASYYQDADRSEIIYKVPSNSHAVSYEHFETPKTVKITGKQILIKEGYSNE